MEDIRKGTCPLCKHNEIVQTSPQDSLGTEAHPMAAVTKRGFFGFPRGELGIFSAFICRSCGYTQWFAHEPDKIPIDAMDRTRLIKGPEPSGPYR